MTCTTVQIWLSSTGLPVLANPERAWDCSYRKVTGRHTWLGDLARDARPQVPIISFLALMMKCCKTSPPDGNRRTRSVLLGSKPEHLTSTLTPNPNRRSVFGWLLRQGLDSSSLHHEEQPEKGCMSDHVTSQQSRNQSIPSTDSVRPVPQTEAGYVSFESQLLHASAFVVDRVKVHEPVPPLRLSPEEPPAKQFASAHL